MLLFHGVSEPGIGPHPPGRESSGSPAVDSWTISREFTARIIGLRPLGELWWLSDYAAQTPLVAVTFDDGHVTDYTIAFPLLQEFGFPR